MKYTLLPTNIEKILQMLPKLFPGLQKFIPFLWRPGGRISVTRQEQGGRQLRGLLGFPNL
jgi:hypothetical protein